MEHCNKPCTVVFFYGTKNMANLLQLDMNSSIELVGLCVPSSVIANTTQRPIRCHASISAAACRRRLHGPAPETKTTDDERASSAPRSGTYQSLFAHVKSSVNTNRQEYRTPFTRRRPCPVGLSLSPVLDRNRSAPSVSRTPDGGSSFAAAAAICRRPPAIALSRSFVGR